MFVAGVVVFTVGSALCGLAPSIEWLVGSRVAQAVGGAMMIPQTLALVPALFPPAERGTAFALFGLSAGLASVVAGLWIVVALIGEAVSSVAFILPLLVAGIGLGTAISPLFNTVLAAVDPPDAGSASGALQAFQQVGGALGVAIVGQLFFSRLLAPGGGAEAAHAAYAHAITVGLVWPVLAFGSLAAAVWLLPAPKGGAGPGAAPEPTGA
jgi:MFS family permease